RAQRASVLHPRPGVRAGAGDARRGRQVRHDARSRRIAGAGARSMTPTAISPTITSPLGGGREGRRRSPRSLGWLFALLVALLPLLAQAQENDPVSDAAVRDREFG